ncbi:hypothetical protein F4777DRAFT_422806 [Nemania sp. FL0916]|nr:hypothetical protein F4777DRAFT_422806 [Nemania sp. FL0916]
MSSFKSLFNRHKSSSRSSGETLSYLRQKNENSVLTKAEAESLIRLAQESNVSLTPAETVTLQQAISSKPPPSEWHPAGDPRPTHRVRAGLRRKPTTEWLPAVQGQSRLFRLPGELRQEIWRLAVGGRKIYMITEKDYVTQESRLDDPYWRRLNGLLTVALLCRQSYLESITLLYSENTFAVGFGSGGTNLEFFKQMRVDLRPKYVEAISSLEIAFHLAEGYTQYYDSHPQAWDLSLQIHAPCSVDEWISAFEAVSELKGLKKLVVVVWASGTQRHQFRHREADMMKIPATMAGLQKFEFWLPWEQDPSIKAELVGENQGTYNVNREFEDRELFGVSVPKYRFDS